MSIEKSAVIAVTEAEFDTIVLGNDRPVIVDFWASWCGPCRFLTPLFEKFAREFGDEALFVKVDRDQAPALRARYDIVSIPRLISFENGALNKVEVGLAGYNFQRKRVMKMLGLSVLGRPTNREKRFEKLVEQANTDYANATKEVQTALMEAYAPVAQKSRDETNANNAALAAGTVSNEQHQTRDKEIKAAFKAAKDGLQHLFDAYEAAIKPAEILYRADIESATDLLFPLPPQTNIVTAATETSESDGAFCAIGDTTCGAAT